MLSLESLVLSNSESRLNFSFNSMKFLISLVFVGFSLKGLSQVRDQLETPSQLKYIQIEWPVLSLPEIVEPPEVVVFFIGCFNIKDANLPLQKRLQTLVINGGLPPQYDGGFVPVSQSQESGWYETTLKRR